MGSLLDAVREKLSGRKEVVVKPVEASETFRRHRSDQLEDAERRAEELVERTSRVLDEVEESLEELKDYSSDEDIQAIDDVTDNIYSSRKKLLQNFQPPEKIEEHLEELSGFVERFNDVSRKEGEVLKHIRSDSGEMGEAAENLVSHLEEMQDFMEDGYLPVKRLDELQEKEEKLENMEEQVRELERKIDSPELDPVREKVDRIEAKITELKNSSEWQEKKKLEERIEKLKDQNDRKIRNLSAEASKMERGLKKLLYQVENGEMHIEGEVEPLEKLKEGKVRTLENVEPALSSAREAIRDNDLLESAQQQKFLEAAENLSDFETAKQRIKNRKKEIEELQEELDQLDVDSRIDELERKKERAEKELEKRKQTLQERKEKLEKKEDRIEQLKQNILEKLDGYLKHDVKSRQGSGNGD